MAYAALASLAQTINLILNYHRDSISPQAKNKIICIEKYVISLQAFLEDFPDKANSLDAIIRAVTHVTEDIIEFFMSEHIYEPHYALLESSVGELKHQPKGKYHLLHDFPDKAARETAVIFVNFLFRDIYDSLESSVGQSESKFQHQPKRQYSNLRCDFHELKEATQEIESIANFVMKIKNSIGVKDMPLGDSTAVSSSSRVAPIHKDATVGFDEDVMEIKSRLCGESSKREVIPVVGMGGIGKTTLARCVYDDQLIMEHFQIRIWVTISQDYNIQQIVSCLLTSMKVSVTKDKVRREIVYQNLKGRQYLIVLDDIWSTEAWDDLKMMFPDDGNGSRIMLTTRLSDVASYADSYSPVHEMSLMDEDQSWNLLRQKVFKQDPCPVELESIGKKIAKRCRGLPLAILVISGLLAVRQTEVAWLNIAENVNSAISANDEQFDKLLSLSYTHLPHHLRMCFLYMGGFPEDYEMSASRLIKLLVAEGFLKPNGCNKSLEETAEEYLEDLVKRNLVLVTDIKSDGRIKSLSMHDLMREMCIRKAQQENFFLHAHKLLPGGTNIPRRVSVIHSDLDFHKGVSGLTIRTILYLGNGGERANFQVRYLRLLRVLDLLDDSSGPIPAELSELFHLRYLALNDLFKTPAAICNLQNLQTLIISREHCHEYISHSQSDFVPFLLEIWSMPQLRHLVIGSGFCFCLPSIQEGATFCLENLQTLSLVINFVSTPKILKMIPNLKKLGISYREWGNHEEDYQLHNLIYLQQLENLKLEIHHRFLSPRKVNPAFPRTLKKLTLSGWRLPWEDMTIVGSLPNLEVLKLREYACVGDTWETTEGEFSQLKFLLINESDLQHWITESSHFPRLVYLVLLHCWYLSEIPSDIGEVPTLEVIAVDYWNKFLVKSAKQIQDDQQSCGNDALQVHFVN